MLHLLDTTNHLLDSTIGILHKKKYDFIKMLFILLKKKRILFKMITAYT